MPFKRADDTRINNEIRVPRVRVVGATGEPLGILPIADALTRAIDSGLDLVEVSPNADPPVCRVMDYGKYKYEKSKKTKEAKKKQHVMHLKEIKLHPKTDAHDFNFKMEHAREFLLQGDRVKITVVFRGREITHTEFGHNMLNRAADKITDIAQMEINPKMEGRSLISIFVPEKIKVKEFLRKRELERKKQEQESAAKPAAPAPEAPTGEQQPQE